MRSLFAKLVDSNGDGILNAGDKVYSSAYPLGFDYPADGVGAFSLTEFTIEPLWVQNPWYCTVRTADGRLFHWADTPVNSQTALAHHQSYVESWQGGEGGFSQWDDSHFVSGQIDGTPPDLIVIDPTSPGQPSHLTDPWLWRAWGSASAADDQFIDVDWNCGGFQYNP